MKISLFSLFCGMILTSRVTYGSNLVRLRNKMVGGLQMMKDQQIKSNVVSIRLRDGNKHVYTGLILDEFYMLTTARIAMLLSFQPEKYEIYYSFPLADELKIKDKHIPKAFTHNRNSKSVLGFNEYDIGYIEICNDEYFGYERSEMCFNFATPYDTTVYRTAYVYGWEVSGNVTHGDGNYRVEQSLRKLKVTVHTREQCARIYNIHDRNFPINLLCIKSPSINQKLDQTDLGSPVVDIITNTVIGIISHVPNNPTDLNAIMINMKVISPWLKDESGGSGVNDVSSVSEED